MDYQRISKKEIVNSLCSLDEKVFRRFSKNKFSTGLWLSERKYYGDKLLFKGEYQVAISRNGVISIKYIGENNPSFSCHDSKIESLYFRLERHHQT